MKSKLSKFYLAGFLLLFCFETFSQAGPETKMQLKTERDSASYAVGILTAYNNIMQLRGDNGGIFLDYELIAKGFRDISLYPFRMTYYEYPISDDLEKDVKKEFGDNWVVADWTQIKQMDFDQLKVFLAIALPDSNKNVIVLRNGEKFSNKDTKVHYFIEYTNFKKPTLYGSLDNVEEYMITLGRAQDMKLRIMAFNPDYAKKFNMAFGFTKGDTIINSFFGKLIENNKLRTLEEGRAFLRENSKRPGVKTTASGLQYEIIKAGNGPIPKSTDKVRVIYKGTLIDNKEFDSTTQRGGPAEFEVTGVIKGWTEALLMMPVGSKWKLYIPAELAYGDRGSRRIKANSALIFEVELLGIL